MMPSVAWGSLDRRNTGPARACWGLLLTLIAAGVFWLPYYVPLSAAGGSESELAGFNNRVALASVWIGLAAATILSFFFPLVGQEDHGQVEADQIGIRPLLVVWAIETAVSVVAGLIAEGSPPIGEAWYFLPRLYYMKQGLFPYRDFEFAYGPALIYPPYWVHRAFGVSIQTAYSICVWAFGLAGNGILWALIRQARAGRRAKLAAFVCLVCWLHIGLALQYTHLRFLCGFGALLVARIVTVSIQMRRRTYALPPIYVALTLAVSIVSPEIGCTFVPGLLAYLILEFGICREFFRLATVYLLLLALCAVRLLPDTLFSVLRGFAAGGNAFPVLPSLYVMLYVGTLIAVFPPVMVDALFLLRGKQVSANRPFGGPLTIAFAVQSICLVPGALGRADLGHVYFYGLGVFLIAILGGWPTRRWQMAYWIAVGSVFQLLGIAVSLHFLSPAYRSAAGQGALHWIEEHPASAAVRYGRSATGETRWSDLQARLQRRRDLSLENGYAQLANLGPICSPLSDPEGDWVLARHGSLKPEYYYSLVNVFTQEQVQRKIADMGRCSYLVLMDSFRPQDEPAPRNSVQRDPYTTRYLEWNLCFPWLPALRKPNPDRDAPISRVIRSEYVLAKRINPNYNLWVKRGISGAAITVRQE